MVLSIAEVVNRIFDKSKTISIIMKMIEYARDIIEQFMHSTSNLMESETINDTDREIIYLRFY